MMNNSDEFEKNVKAKLDKGTEDLSPEIARRLQQARYAALDKATSRTRWSFFPHTAAATFAVAAVSVSLFYNFMNNDVTETELAMETEIEMFTSVDTLELMEDLEFMQWLAESEEYAS